MQLQCTALSIILLPLQGQAITSVERQTESWSHHDVPGFVEYSILSAVPGLLQSLRQRWVRMREMSWSWLIFIACSDKALSIAEFTMLCQQLFRKPQGAPYQ